MPRTLVIGAVGAELQPSRVGPALGELVTAPTLAEAVATFDPGSLDALVLGTAQTAEQVAQACQQLAASSLETRARPASR